MKNERGLDLDKVDPDGLRRVGAALRGHGYTEAGVRDRLGLSDLPELKLIEYPDYLEHRLARNEPLDVAIRLFLLQGRVTEEDAAALLDRAGRDVLRQAGLLAGDRQRRAFRTRASIYPLGERNLFFTDHRYAHDAWLRARVPREPVMYLGADSYYLARTTVRKPARAVLDLCTGSGVHAILAAEGADRAVGVDVNRRAVRFARLNAMLNDTWNAVFFEGDLLAPVAGERYDLILANPPFVPSPVYELAFRDGGPSGADVLRRIVAALPDALTRTGTAHIVTHIAERDGESYLERVRRWLGGANMNLHSLRLGSEDIVSYTIAQTRRAFRDGFPRYSARLNDWLTNLRAQRFRRVAAVVLTLQWNEEAPHPPWTQEDEAKRPTPALSDELARLLAAKRRARTELTPASLERMRAGVPDDLVLIEHRRPSGGRFEVQEQRVLFRDALLSPELEIKPLVRDLLARVDNKGTVPEVIARLARESGRPLSELDLPCRQAFVAMFERGLVTLDPVSEADPERGRGGAPAPAQGKADRVGAGPLTRTSEEPDPA